MKGKVVRNFQIFGGFFFKLASEVEDSLEQLDPDASNSSCSVQEENCVSWLLFRVDLEWMAKKLVDWLPYGESAERD